MTGARTSSAETSPEAMAEPAPATDEPADPALPQLNSLGHTMLSVVINPPLRLAERSLPGHPYHQTIIYEAHVKGMTATHPDVPASCAERMRDCAIRRSSII